jgi:3-hydroxyacyl-CoA dehydrogenase
MTTSTPLNLGFIGLGVMGAPMAGHLAAAGHRLTLLDADAAVARAGGRPTWVRVRGWPRRPRWRAPAT